METDKIIANLNRRFAEPLPEFYKRRIIFWRDEEREFLDKLNEMRLDNAKIAIVRENNVFEIKKLLTVDDVYDNYLVYTPFSYKTITDLENDWLLNIELYSEEFYADLYSIWMNEMGVPSSPLMRNFIKRYHKFFNNKERRAKFAALKGGNEYTCHLAVMAVICGLKDASFNTVLRTVLIAGADNSTNEVYRELTNYGAEKAFWAIVARMTGYKDIDPKVTDLASHIMLTSLTYFIPEEKLKGVSRYISSAHIPYCHDFVSEWMHSVDNDGLFQIASALEQKHNLKSYCESLAIEDLVTAEGFPCIDDCILVKLMNEIADGLSRTSNIDRALEKRRATVWYPHFSNYYEAIGCIALMHNFYLEHYSDGFHCATAKDLWDLYVSSYYKMDSYYREFIRYYMNCLKDANPLLDDAIKTVFQTAEGLYSDWFLGNLNDNWYNLCASEMQEYGHIQGVNRQDEFYKTKVKRADNKVYVIISDALRYSVGMELAEQLRIETQCKINVSSCQAIFPGITKFGMAALLPHDKLSIVKKGDILSVYADGQPTDSGCRDSVLKSANRKSAAIRYKDVIELKRADRQELVKGKDVVYIYHDRIDETAHTSETAVFDACDEAIIEIKNLVKIICNDFGGTRILITADHGFLYTARPLQEFDKVDKKDFDGKDVEYGRRYAIMQKDSALQYLLPVKFLDGTQYDGYTPRDNVRIKLSGGGMNYVHGGISLQEITVPVIEYHFLRNSYLEYRQNRDKIDTKPAEIAVLSATRKIYNLIVSLNFYQKQPVVGNIVPETYLLYFVDEQGIKISNTVRIIANKTSEKSQERIFKCDFDLKQNHYDSKAKYYLIIQDESGTKTPQKEEYQIDIAFSLGSFNLFDDDNI